MRPVPRRTFLAWAIGGALAALAATTSVILALGLRPLRRPQTRLRLERPLEQLGDGEAWIVSAPPGAAFVMADGGGSNHPGDVTQTAFAVRSCGKVEVLAANCSHLGCMVNFDAVEQRFKCPCHGSRYSPRCGMGGSEFAVDGSVERGPARHGLAHIRWRTGSSPDQVYIDTRARS